MQRCFVILALTLCIFLPLTASAESSKAQQYEDAHAAAVAAREQAGQIGNQWTTTGDVLSAAEEAADGGDYEHANELAERAEALAKLAIEQARDNDKTWRKAMPE